MRERNLCRLASAIALVGVLMVAPFGRADAGQGGSGEPSTTSELSQAFGVDQVRSDFVVVIDTSSSMVAPPDPLYPKVKEAFAGLVDVLPEGDHLSVVTFDSVPTTGFNADITAANRDSAKVLPPADGGATDIGAALSSAVEKVDRSDGAPIQTVIFITDGKPEPPPGSAFDPVGSPAWKAAKARAAAVEKRRDVMVRALGLTDAGKRGAELAGQVFSNPEVVRLSGDQLRDYLTNEVKNAQQRALARAVQDEIDRGSVDVKIRPNGKLDDQVKAEVTLTSDLEHLGVDVDLESVAARDFDGHRVRSSIIGGSRTVHLPPRGSTTFEIILNPKVGRPPLFALPPPGREEVQVTLDFAQSVHATPTKVLEEQLQVDTEVQVDAPDPVIVGRATGKTWGRFLFELILLVVVLLVLFKVYWRFLRKAPMAGRLMGLGVASGIIVELHGKKMKVTATDFGRVGATTLRLYARRGKAGVVYAERVGIDGSFERKAKSRWKPVEAGASLGLSEYRLDGDSGVRFRFSKGGDDE